MTADRWKRVDEVFQLAADLEGGEREACLQRECATDAGLLAEVRALLAHDEQAQGFVEKQVEEGVLEFHEVETTPAARKAGPYILTRELGRGGMGAVYLGERADGQYIGEVAVKIVRPGMDTDFFLARFKRERQALARLQHPNIARLLDSGTSDDGSPYIVMEKVDGRPVNVYCREENVTIPQILRLYLEVCRAVAHAHRHFVVHRDLKPGNILVEAGGTPKLLDFGICKMLMGATAAGEAGGTMHMTMETARMMTPDYASPEQVRGDPITIASDIYSLGAVLYELLTGRRPHAIDRYTPQAVAKAVCEEDVIKPSSTVKDAARRKQICGDLDTILLKAMQKEPERRYESVEQFGEDLRRVLDDEPVLARPDSALYRVRKFVHRHAAAVAISTLAILMLTGGLIAYARKAESARQESAEARRLANAMLFEIHDRVKNLPGSLPAREAIVRTGLDYLDRLAARTTHDSALRRELAAAYLRMGQVQGSVFGSYTGDTDGALTSFRKGLAAMEGTPESAESGRIQMDLNRAVGQILDTRDGAKALEYLEKGLTLGKRLHQRYPNDDEITIRLAGLYQSNALALRANEQRPKALEHNKLALGLYTHLIEKRPQDRELRAEVAALNSSAGAIEANLRQTEAARQSLKQAVEQWEELCRQDPANNSYQRHRMLAYSHLGDLLGNPAYPNLGDPTGAMAAFQSMIAVAEQRYNDNPGDQGAAIDYGMALARVANIPIGDPAQRLTNYDKAATLLQHAIDKDPANTTVPVNLASQKEQAGDLLASLGKRAEALEAWRASLRIVDGKQFRMPAAQRIAITASQKLAEDYARRGDAAQAISLANHAVAIGEQSAAIPKASMPVKLNRPRGYAAMGAVQALLHHDGEARHWRERALEELVKLEQEPGFTAANRELRQTVEAALKK